MNANRKVKVDRVRATMQSISSDEKERYTKNPHTGMFHTARNVY